MLKKFIEYLMQFRAQKEVSEILHKKNRRVLEKIFIFAVAFGIFGLIYTNFKFNEIKKFQLAYYLYYYFVGVVGVILCCTKSGKYTPGAYALISFFVIFLVFIAAKPFIESIVIFLGFALAIEMLVNINPIVYVSSLIFSEGLLTVLISLGYIHGKDEVSGAAFANLMLVNVIAIYLAFWKRRIVLKKYDTERKIAAEKAKSEELLLNVLPQNIINQLRENGKADPEMYENVTVLFCEIINFKDYSESVEPELLVTELNAIYDLFDQIVERNSCLRIKTFGEIYMTVCGLPESNEHHAEHIMACAKEFLAAVKERNKTAAIKFEVKIGISSGSVIAGIVGIKKYIYDVFGDTVNTAFRMKTLCSDMQIQVSPDTYTLICDKFEFSKHSPINVKGKGLMETYYLNTNS